jgi:hypothetical protein
MDESILKSALFDIEISSSKQQHNIKAMEYKPAWDLVQKVLRESKDDLWLQEELPRCISSFGFTGISHGGRRIMISAYKPVLRLDEKHTCGRRMDGLGPWEHEEMLDYWEMRGDDKCCSFCGSLHPDRVIELLKERGSGILEPSTKSYKWYLNRPEIPNASFGGIKYYRQHDTPGFIEKINQITGGIPYPGQNLN